MAIKGTVPELIDPPPSCRFVERCIYAVEVCRTFDPQLTDVSGGHGVSCFIHHPPGRDSETPSFSRRTS
jgi:oligopeptide/dipeptide ABC transporter ATP-binding protein